MRYHYEEAVRYTLNHGRIYICDHPVYSRCTLFIIGVEGLAVIQQRYDPETKHTWWGEVDESLWDDLYLHPKFIKYFDSKAASSHNGLFPTVTIRQIMWALRMKPLKREPWETTFDKSPF